LQTTLSTSPGFSCNAVAKRFAFPAVIHDAAVERLAFRIAAPLTPKRTTLVKDQGSDPFSIMSGKSLDIENHDIKNSKGMILNTSLKCKSFHNKCKEILNESEINFE
jgi:hypothetical protein